MAANGGCQRELLLLDELVGRLPLPDVVKRRLRARASVADSTVSPRTFIGIARHQLPSHRHT
jgi:hypothetical protein